MSGLKKSLILILALGLAGYVSYNRISKWHQETLDKALEKEQAQWREKNQSLETRVANLQEELLLLKEATLPRERLKEVFGEEAADTTPAREQRSCEELDRQARDFFAYLDKKEYIQAYGQNIPTFTLFQQMISQLSENRPLITGEMQDPSVLIQNVAHFYRVLGKKKVRMIRDILTRETEIIETISALFYEWLLAFDRCKEGINEGLSLEVLYQYSGFFLNSLAGKSYLLRRDSKVRILTTYYCVLILDRANQEMLNRQGIDIRPHIDFSFYDIRNQRGLVFQKQYLDTLTGLKEKYRLEPAKN